MALYLLKSRKFTSGTCQFKLLVKPLFLNTLELNFVELNLEKSNYIKLFHPMKMNRAKLERKFGVMDF